MVLVVLESVTLILLSYELVMWPSVKVIFQFCGVILIDVSESTCFLTKKPACATNNELVSLASVISKYNNIVYLKPIWLRNYLGKFKKNQFQLPYYKLRKYFSSYHRIYEQTKTVKWAHTKFVGLGWANPLVLKHYLFPAVFLILTI